MTIAAIVYALGVPVGFGLTLSQLDYKEDSTKETRRAFATSIVLGVMWPVLALSVIFGFAVAAVEKITGEDK